ncbi:MAG TPA: DUF2262 domain-containing protein [Longimicrobium sp.]|nr:DUF2262 domain-containing protein [Longimicrobium sp.]
MRLLRGLLALVFGTAAPGAAQRPASPTAGGELITGVVDPRGAAGVQVRPDEPDGEWVLVFSFHSWRGADGVVHPTRLDVRRTCTHAEMREGMDRVNAARVISARVRFTGPAEAELLELADASMVADDPLTRHALERAAIVTREDERFGTLTLNRSVGWWEGRVPWAGDTIDLQLPAEGEDELSAALEVARALWDDEAGWSERIQAYAVEQLLPMKNEGWLDDDEEPLTPAEFRARMRLEAIAVEADGSFTFWHNDGDLFWGHSIQIMGNLQDGPTDADIPG